MKLVTSLLAAFLVALSFAAPAANEERIPVHRISTANCTTTLTLPPTTTDFSLRTVFAAKTTTTSFVPCHGCTLEVDENQHKIGFGELFLRRFSNHTTTHTSYVCKPTPVKPWRPHPPVFYSNNVSASSRSTLTANSVPKTIKITPPATVPTAHETGVPISKRDAEEDNEINGITRIPRRRTRFPNMANRERTRTGTPSNTTTRATAVSTKKRSGTIEAKTTAAAQSFPWFTLDGGHLRFNSTAHKSLERVPIEGQHVPSLSKRVNSIESTNTSTPTLNVESGAQAVSTTEDPESWATQIEDKKPPDKIDT